jgi:hypothetical protein
MTIPMTLLRNTVVCVGLLCTACSGPLKGPHVDLAAIARPEPVAEVILPPPPPLTSPAPRVSPGTFQAWVPREETANGDIIDGHYLVISLTPPAVETLEPATIMPRAPREHLSRKPPGSGAPPIPVIPAPGGLPSPMMHPQDPTGANDRTHPFLQRGQLQ